MMETEGKILYPPHVLGTLHRRQRGRDADVIRGAIIALRRPLRMSAYGYKRTLEGRAVMSALPPRADISGVA